MSEALIAYKEKHEASEKFLALVYGDGPRQAIAKDFLPTLAALPLERAKKIPCDLREEIFNCSCEAESAVIEAGTSGKRWPLEISKLSNSLKEIDEIVKRIKTAISTAEKDVVEHLIVKRNGIKNIYTNFASVSDLAEIHVLATSCRETAAWDELGELYDWIRQSSGSGNLIQQLTEFVSREVSKSIGILKETLLGPLTLPQALKTVSGLRRLWKDGGSKEDPVKRLFLVSRFSFVETKKKQIEQFLSISSSSRTIKEGSDILRVHVSDLCMQFRALFGSSGDVLPAWVIRQISWFEQLMRRELEDRNFREIDGSSLAAIFRLCHHTSATLRRVGAGGSLGGVGKLLKNHLVKCMKEGSNDAVISFDVATNSKLNQPEMISQNDDSVEGLIASISTCHSLSVFYNETVFWLNETRFVAGDDTWLIAQTLIEESVSRIDQLARKKWLNINTLIDGPLVKLFRIILNPKP